MKIPNIFEADTQPEIFVTGAIIFSEGQPGDVMFIVKEGEVELQVRGNTVETVIADGFFGEMAVIEGGIRSATAIAKTDCTLMPVNAKRFEFMVHEVPFFAVQVMKILAIRLRNYNQHA